MPHDREFPRPPLRYTELRVARHKRQSALENKNSGYRTATSVPPTFWPISDVNDRIWSTTDSWALTVEAGKQVDSAARARYVNDHDTRTNERACLLGPLNSKAVCLEWLQHHAGVEVFLLPVAELSCRQVCSRSRTSPGVKDAMRVYWVLFPLTTVPNSRLVDSSDSNQEERARLVMHRQPRGWIDMALFASSWRDL